jgi:hypothetical protein
MEQAMLTKMKLRALSPGQWARIVVPEYDQWKERAEWSGPLAGKEVDICVIPCYGPRYEDKEHFHGNYRCAYRCPVGNGGATWPHYYDPKGSMLSTYDFGLIDASMSGPNWDKDVSDAKYAGRGVYLYEPASDNPELCPGGDWSRYECDCCGKFVKPFSNDQGELVCPWCEGTGLLILDDEQLDRLEQVREFARSMGLTEQLERQLGYLAGYGDQRNQVVLGYDFAPHSFSFGMYRPGPKEERKCRFNGGLIYQGPSSPADGSFPSLTVSLASGTGWFCHT